jgi:hypothetical protein
LFDGWFLDLVVGFFILGGFFDLVIGDLVVGTWLFEFQLPCLIAWLYKK